MRKIKEFIFNKMLILLKTILFINFVNNSYCKKENCCPQYAKQKGGNNHKYQELVFIDLPEKIEEYNEDIVKQIKNVRPKDEKVTLENIKKYINDEIEMIKNRECKEYKKEELHLSILYIIKDDNLIASKILKCGDFDEKYYDTKFDEHSYNCNFQKTKKTYIDFWFDSYLKEGVYSFEKLKEFWNKYKPTYLRRYKKYPVFYFEKNETNKKYFEDPEEDKKK